MLTLYIRNVKTVNDIADYKYVAMVNAEVIAEGMIFNHRRADGWAQLVKRIAISHEEGKDE